MVKSKLMVFFEAVVHCSFLIRANVDSEQFDGQVETDRLFWFTPISFSKRRQRFSDQKRSNNKFDGKLLRRKGSRRRQQGSSFVDPDVRTWSLDNHVNSCSNGSIRVLFSSNK